MSSQGRSSLPPETSAEGPLQEQAAALRNKMSGRAEIHAGICGFRTTVRVRTEDGQHVLFDVKTDCEKVRQLGARLQALGPLDAFQEINPANGSRVLQTARASLTGCCAGCAVPVGLFKAMQVAAGLALPKDVHIGLALD